MWETSVQPLGREDALEKGMTTHSSILARRIPWTKKTVRRQPRGSQRVGRDWVIHTLLIEAVEAKNASFGAKDLSSNHDSFLQVGWTCAGCITCLSLNYPHLYNGTNHSTFHKGMTQGINKILYLMLLEYHLLLCKSSTDVNYCHQGLDSFLGTRK